MRTFGTSHVYALPHALRHYFPTTMKFISAIDSFKGCLTSAEAGYAACAAISHTCKAASCRALTVSDGGEGMLEAFSQALGAQYVSTTVSDPLGRSTTARYATVADTAIIETAQACGMALLRPDELSPLTATTRGVGELITDAFGRGCRHFIIGLGGSATSDAGMGMLRAIAEAASPTRGIYGIGSTQLAGCRFTLISDVTNPLYGPSGAAHVFARQKGASPTDIEELDRRARKIAAEAAAALQRDMSSHPGAGAAGGLGYAFMQFLGAECRPGADYLLDLLHFDSMIDADTTVITGEGHADRQTLMGKLPYRIMRRAALRGAATWLIAGGISDARSLTEAGFALTAAITPPSMPLSEAMDKPTAIGNIQSTITRLIIENYPNAT